MPGIKIFTNSFLLALSCLAQEPDYFPLEVGNQWIYRSSGATATVWTLEVTAKRDAGGHAYFELHGLPGGPALVRKNESGSLVLYDPQEKREKTWVALGAAPGEAFRSEIDACSATALISSREAVARVPLGEFHNGLEVAYQIAGCADAGLQSEIFLPDVGLLQRRQMTIVGPQTFDLIYARLGGFTVLSEGEVSFAATLDRSVYRPGEMLTVRMTLRNTQDQPLELHFPSGQDYDVVIRNETGDVVFRWSDGKAFTQVFRKVELRGERNWVALIPLGPGGASLGPGRYSATAGLAVQNARYEASVAFNIEARR